MNTQEQSHKGRVAVIILNWNGKALLGEFLPSVINNTDSSVGDIIVADNGSDDGSVEFLKESFPDVRLIEFEQNYGFAEGYNRAVQLCSDYSYCVLLNSDVEPAFGWLSPLVAYAEANPEVAALQPKILSYKNRSKFEYAGASGGFIDCHGYPFCRGRIFDTVETDNKQYDLPMQVFWASGAALFIRTEVYMSVGGLDSHFFAHMEEIDLCWRINLAGFKIMVVPQAVVYHLGGGSLPASNPKKTYLNFRNNLLLLHKNLPARSKRGLLFVRRLYDTVAFAMFILKVDFRNARAVIKAHRDFRRMRKLYYKDEMLPIVNSNLLSTFSYCNKNIIIAYYLRHKSTFDKL